MEQSFSDISLYHEYRSARETEHLVSQKTWHDLNLDPVHLEDVLLTGIGIGALLGGDEAGIGVRRLVADGAGGLLIKAYLQWYGFGHSKITEKHPETLKPKRGHNSAGYISTMIRMSRKY